MKTSRVAIIGAGFSGLTLALELVRLGVQVEIFEAKSQAGGLIQSRKGQVLVETAAHALLASQDVEDLFTDLGVVPVQAGFVSKSKWIFRHKARKWPLAAIETAQTLWALARAKWAGALLPRSFESLSAWADRNALSKFRELMLAPALQGVYGSQPENLAASLVLGALFTPELRLRKGKSRGSLAPKHGMQELIDQMVETLKSRQARFHFQTVASVESLQNSFDAVIVAASARGAAEILKDSTPHLAAKLRGLPMVSLLTVTLGSMPASSRIQGFGCLFPRKEKFHSLGVLFNSDLFENRGPLENETWIFPETALGKTDSEVLSDLLEDRRRLCDEEFKFQFAEVIRWPAVLPLYGSELESLLRSDVFERQQSSLKNTALQIFHQGARVRESEKPLYLSGNYLGGIGLTKILSYNKRLAVKIYQELCGGLK